MVSIPYEETHGTTLRQIKSGEKTYQTYRRADRRAAFRKFRYSVVLPSGIALQVPFGSRPACREPNPAAQQGKAFWRVRHRRQFFTGMPESIQSVFRHVDPDGILDYAADVFHGRSVISIADKSTNNQDRHRAIGENFGRLASKI